MGNTKLDPRSLNAEERAIVDHEASRFHRDWTGEARYEAALSICEPIILARRAIFGEPASEGGKVCEKCGRPQDPNALHCVAFATVDKAQRQQVEYRYTCQAASEGGKVKYLCPYCGVATDGPTHLRKLEHGAEWTCNRKCSNCLAPSGDHELCERCESILKRKPAPAVAMTEELERVLNFAAIRHKDANTDTRVLWDPEYLVAVGKAIAAVRSQAAEAGKVPTFTNARHYLAITEAGSAFNGNLRYWRAAIAELNASEGRK